MRKFFISLIRILRRHHLWHFALLRSLKASTLLMIAPIMVLSIYTIYDRLPFLDMVYGLTAIFIITVFVIRPYLSDLTSLNQYVNQLALDRHVDAPALSFLSNVGELSKSVNTLHASWEQKKVRLESMLVESRILFDTLPDLLIMLDKGLYITRANSSAHITFGGNITHKKLTDIITAPAVFNVIKSVLDTNESGEIEVYFERPLDRYFLVRVERFPIQAKGGISVILIMHDVTNTKRTEQMFADFVANASHEIRTPLTSLVGYIELLRTTAKEDQEAQEKFLLIMAEQAERMKNLVSALLSLSKIEMNVSSYPTDLIEIQGVVESAMNHVEFTAQERDMDINVQYSAHLPVIMGDYNELVQVLCNLLSNAIKYSNRHSEVNVTVGTTDAVPVNQEGEELLKRAIYIAVQDHGVGIDKSHLPRLTERFYRVDSARSRKIGGSGLGLAIVKYIILRHRGVMTIESETGKGSIFTVYLPFAEDLQLKIPPQS